MRNLGLGPGALRGPRILEQQTLGASDGEVEEAILLVGLNERLEGARAAGVSGMALNERLQDRDAVRAVGEHERVLARVLSQGDPRLKLQLSRLHAPGMQGVALVHRHEGLVALEALAGLQPGARRREGRPHGQVTRHLQLGEHLELLSALGIAAELLDPQPDGLDQQRLHLTARGSVEVGRGLGGAEDRDGSPGLSRLKGRAPLAEGLGDLGRVVAHGHSARARQGRTARHGQQEQASEGQARQQTPAVKDGVKGHGLGELAKRWCVRGSVSRW